MAPVTAGSAHSSLEQLVDIASDLARGDGPSALANAAPPAARIGFRLLDAENYDAWVLCWPPGSRVEPHDHGASQGVFVVAAGELTEIRWTDDGRVARRLAEGEVCLLPSGLIHDVAATGDTPAISIHVYSPPLTEMGFYDADGTTLVAVEATGTDPVFDSRCSARA